MSMKVPTRLRTALKESEAVVRAMGDGVHFLLLQQVQDATFRGHFPLSDLEFFLIPDPAGRQSASIRPEFRSYAEGPSENDGEKVTVRYKAAALEVVMLMRASDLKPLTPFHVWTEEYVQERFRWDPVNPLFVMTCKVYKVDPPLVIADPGRGPWVQIQEQELPDASYESVIEHNDFLKAAIDIKKAVAEVQKNPVDLPAPPAPPKPAAPPPKPPAKPATAKPPAAAPPKPAAAPPKPPEAKAEKPATTPPEKPEPPAAS